MWAQVTPKQRKCTLNTTEHFSANDEAVFKCDVPKRAIQTNLAKLILI